jgi:hypothetical protein
MITNVKHQQDRFGEQKGRTAHLMADKAFYEYCEMRGFKLEFAGEYLTCITQAEKSRQNAVQANRARIQQQQQQEAVRPFRSGYQRRPGEQDPSGPGRPYSWGKRPRN